jgi:hypothetical protein
MTKKRLAPTRFPSIHYCSRIVFAATVLVLLSTMTYAQEPSPPVFCTVDVTGEPAFVEPANLKAERYPLRFQIFNNLGAQIHLDPDTFQEEYWHTEYDDYYRAYLWSDAPRRQPVLLRRHIFIDSGDFATFDLSADDPLPYARVIGRDPSQRKDEDPEPPFVIWRALYESELGNGTVECRWFGR